MKRQIIITDLTRFTGDQTICTAGIDYNTMECIPPCRLRMMERTPWLQPQEVYK